MPSLRLSMTWLTTSSAEQAEAVADYKRQASLKSDLARTDLAKEKTGVWTGAYAINPVNGKEIPIWIADYVLTQLRNKVPSWPCLLTMNATGNLPNSFDLEIIPVLEGGNA